MENCTREFFTPWRVFLFHPPLGYSEFLKRNDDALFIRVVGGGHTSSSSVPNHGVLLYFLLNTCSGGKLYQTIFTPLRVCCRPDGCCVSLLKPLLPPMNYSEFLQRNDDALLIHVVGGGQTPTTACCFIFTEHPQWRTVDNR
jgi:hypothetical protein